MTTKDLFQDDSDNDSQPNILTINDDFASRLEFQGQLALKQKFESLGDDALVPLDVVLKVVDSAKDCRRLLLGDGSIDEAIRTSVQNFWYPGRIAAFVLKKFGLTPSPTIKARVIPKEFEMPIFGSIEEKAVNEIILMKEMKRSSGDLMRWARSLFHKQTADANVASMERKRSRKEVLGTDDKLTPVECERPQKLNRQDQKQLQAENRPEGNSSEHIASSCSRAHMKFETEDTTQGQGGMPQYVLPPIFSNPHKRVKKRKINNRKPRGRGAGKGRGLNHLGEPPFDDLHVSWQLKRRIFRRQRKVVSKALSSNDNSEPITVVL